ncbi:hypothetical protein LOK49_LG03G02924 [Camellia lanceoleosa]|uniref:Uncharacterized protein n=1 Tax=Camellia lanceoleosa TaxID=1840588 RepID=A0ACC0I9D6_9ERIC|nr:hypothetical protein LOK49_LG03G02924 [Camellia lanceoleosa]
MQLVPGGSPDPECVVVCKIAFVSAVKLADLKKNADEQESLVFATLAGDLVLREGVEFIHGLIWWLVHSLYLSGSSVFWAVTGVCSPLVLLLESIH